jgi:hypothetical protein
MLLPPPRSPRKQQRAGFRPLRETPPLQSEAEGQTSGFAFAASVARPPSVWAIDWLKLAFAA